MEMRPPLAPRSVLPSKAISRLTSMTLVCNHIHANVGQLAHQRVGVVDNR
jgi:hypothetical protein